MHIFHIENIIDLQYVVNLVLRSQSDPLINGWIRMEKMDYPDYPDGSVIIIKNDVTQKITINDPDLSRYPIRQT